MSSPQRLKILNLLKQPEKHFSKQYSADPVQFGVCVTLIAEALEVSQPTATRHIDILKQAGFITTKRHEKWTYCQRDEKMLANYVQWLKSEIGLPVIA